MTMFLNRYLREEYGITTEAVIGYCNDSTDDVFFSHAWLELDVLKTDLTLNVVEHPHVVPNGAALVLDRVLREGAVRHSYHREPTEVGMAHNRVVTRDPELKAMLLHKDMKHRQMLACVTDPEAMAAFMDGAPTGLRYVDLLRSVS